MAEALIGYSWRARLAGIRSFEIPRFLEKRRALFCSLIWKIDDSMTMLKFGD